MERFTKTDSAQNSKNWREKNCDHKSLKYSATKSEEADDTESFFSDITFTITAALAKFQAHHASATTGTSIPEDLTSKGIYADAGARMKLVPASTQSNIYTITIKIGSGLRQQSLISLAILCGF